MTRFALAHSAEELSAGVGLMLGLNAIMILRLFVSTRPRGVGCVIVLKEGSETNDRQLGDREKESGRLQRRD